jgi:hypothetical protein
MKGFYGMQDIVCFVVFLHWNKNGGIVSGIDRCVMPWIAFIDSPGDFFDNVIRLNVMLIQDLDKVVNNGRAAHTHDHFHRFAPWLILLGKWGMNMNI